MITVLEYDPLQHDIAALAGKQNEAVESGAAKMLKWEYSETGLYFPHQHPFFLAFAGDIAVGGAGFNIQYEGTNCVELGAAYVAPSHRGMQIYHKLTEARIGYVVQQGFDMITFANESSAPILKADFGLVKAEHVPPQAFDLCAGCNDNANRPLPACINTCCDRETILALPTTPQQM